MKGKKTVISGTAGTVVYRNRRVTHAETDYRLRERKVARAAKRWAQTVELWQLDMEPWDQTTRGLKKGVLQNV